MIIKEVLINLTINYYYVCVFIFNTKFYKFWKLNIIKFYENGKIENYHPYSCNFNEENICVELDNDMDEPPVSLSQSFYEGEEEEEKSEDDETDAFSNLNRDQSKESEIQPENQVLPVSIPSSSSVVTNDAFSKPKDTSDDCTTKRKTNRSDVNKTSLLKDNDDDDNVDGIFMQWWCNIIATL